MKDVDKLVKDQNYEGIMNLESPKYNIYKCITLINMENYKEAMKYADYSSFELAYINYKLKNYKKCLKIIENNDKSDPKFQILMSQVLYNTGRYNEAYDMLAKYKLCDEVAVNLQAMESLSTVAHESNQKTPPSPYSLTKLDEMVKFKNLSGYQFSDKELEKEFRYNKTFTNLINKNLYVSFLEKSYQTSKCKFIGAQLNNLLGQFEKIDISLLGKSDLEILKFNMGEIQSFDKPVHYETNFNPIKKKYWPINDYACYKKALEMDYNVDECRIPAKSDNLVFLNAFINFLKMHKGKKFSRKYFSTNLDKVHWRILDVLSTRNKELKKNRKKILDLIYFLNKK